MQSGALFTEQAALFEKGVQAVEVVVSSPVSAHIASLFFWGVTLLLVGWIWAYLFLRKSFRTAQILFAFGFGFVVMPLHILLGTIAAASGIIPQDEFTQHALATFSANTDTSYAILHLLVMFVLGIILVIGREVIHTARKGAEAYPAESV